MSNGARWFEDRYDVNVPAPNALDAGSAGLRGETTYSLQSEAIERIRADDAFVSLEAAFIQSIRSHDSFGREAFVVDLDAVGLDHGVAFGGQRGSLNPLESFGAARPTWEVAANDLTWLLRHASVDGTARVTLTGQISIEWTVRDSLDLSAQTGRPWQYKLVSRTLGKGWHGWLGASAPETSGTWVTQY